MAEPPITSRWGNRPRPTIAVCHGLLLSLKSAGPFEERTLALADKLWKGKRDTDLELAVIDEAAIRPGVGRWNVSARLDLAFEGIAARADERLRRSLT